MKTEQQQNAKNLYLQTDKTQSEIAEILNVDRKTIYMWSKKGRWEELKIAARQMPRVILQDIYNHIEEVNKKIRERENKCPKMKEIEKLRKLTNMTKLFVNKNIGSYIEAFEELTYFIARNDYEFCKKVTTYADQYIQGTFGDDENFYIDQRVQENVASVVANLVKQEKEEVEEKQNQQEEEIADQENINDSAHSTSPLERAGESSFIDDSAHSTSPSPGASPGLVEGEKVGDRSGKNGAFSQTQQNEDNPLTNNNSESTSDTTKCPILLKKENENDGEFSSGTTAPASEIFEENTAAYYATLPPARRPAPFREGNIIWINHPKDMDDYEKHMMMSDIVRYYPDMDPSLRYNRL